jgi:hypothetical protein
MSTRVSRIAASCIAGVIFCCFSTASASRRAQPMSKRQAEKIVVETLRYAVKKSRGRVGAKRAIGNRRGLMKAVKNHGVKVKMNPLTSGPSGRVYSFFVEATINTKKGKPRKDVNPPGFGGDVDALTGKVTAFTIRNGQIVRGNRFIRQLLPDFGAYLSLASSHIGN